MEWKTNEKINEIRENYKCTKQIQNQLHLLSEQLSDEYVTWYNKTHEDKIPLISDKQNRQYQKQQKLLLNEIGIATTLQMNLTEHLNTLSDEEEKRVLAEINELYQQLFTVQNKKEFKQLHKKYLKLKEKLNEPQQFEYQNINLSIRPRQITINSYDKKSIRAALRYLDAIDMEARIDILQALSVVKFSKKQANILNKYMSGESLTDKETYAIDDIVKKLTKILNNQNIYKMKL